MPRTARAIIGGVCYHVLNRGNCRARVFHSDRDYQYFEDLIGHAGQHRPMRVLAFCLMPNHFHLVVWPYEDVDLSRWMHWLLTTHAASHHDRHGTSGRVWQGRFKAFPIQQDGHLLTVLRYVERNPLRARLVERAQDWPWSSLRRRFAERSWPPLHAAPVPLPSDWVHHVNLAQTTAELEALRVSANRGRPFGDTGWTDQTAKKLGLTYTLRPRGRPPRRKLERAGTEPAARAQK